MEPRALFDGIAERYDGPAEVLSFGQYGRWRRALVRALHLSPDARVLDVATGTGLIAADIKRAYGCDVVGLDQSERMLARAGARVDHRTGGNADALPFGDESFDTVVFSYLLRYVKDPEATLRELARVLRPGGTLASVEFGVPQAWWARAGWRAQALGVMPLVTKALSPGWAEVGSFLGPNIVNWARDWPVERQVDAWERAGVVDVRVRRMTFGTAVLLRGRKRAR